MSSTVFPLSFFNIDNSNSSIFHPTTQSKGPWDPTTLHGRVISGLAAYEVERFHLQGSDKNTFQLARLTVDMFRPAPMAALTVTNEVVRAGRRIKVIEVKIEATVPKRGHVEIARSSAVLLRRSKNPPGDIWTPSKWKMSAPEENLPYAVEGAPQSKSIWHSVSPEGTTTENLLSSRRLWIRETHNLVSGVEPSQLVKVAQVADFANPGANSGTNGLNYINADVCLYLHRDPVGMWIGTESFYHGSDSGVSVGTIALYDKNGRIGTSTVCALGQDR